jgi:hypothetical protein
MLALEDNFVQIVSNHTAGDPMHEEVIWTYLSATEIAQRLSVLGTPVCPDTVRDLLQEFGFHKRQVEKTKTMVDVAGRNEQFEIIASLRDRYMKSPNPIISMDSKKKELLGEFFRGGRSYSNGTNSVYDHDYPTSCTRKLIPHGLYDLKRNVGHITLGFSHDTGKFACDSFALWWRRHGARAYLAAKSILLLCDAGGSNNCRYVIFKEDLQRLVNRIGLPIRVAHYPAYCSKYNPIDHRLFPHVTRAWSGVIFRSLEIVKECLRRVWTRTGLRVTHAVLNKRYEVKRQISHDFLKSVRFGNQLPEWNYTVVPSGT